ncbi:MAG: 5-methyltetrahydropteroyltriglutamate--homocysteine S-methyltransferase [Brevinematales bacterium]|nr:5-methyltetrahydropteroyltriglutamate--homocysteine S-methyltransferase [Brevinematales bacterium]
MRITLVGFPRLGKNREWKKSLENYWAQHISQKDLLSQAYSLQKEHIRMMSCLDEIPLDFAFYDHMLETSFLLGIIPESLATSPLSSLDQYFALARGYQSSTMERKAWPMKKWFFTNYHYVVPTIDQETIWKPDFFFLSQKISLASETQKPVRITIVGPYTFFKLSRKHHIPAESLKEKLLHAYMTLFSSYPSLLWQIDEPSLVTDMSEEDTKVFLFFYQHLASLYGKNLHLQTYFGDIRDVYQKILSLPFRSLGLDFVDGRENLSLLARYGFPENTLLYAGIVSGRNIWKTPLHSSSLLLSHLTRHIRLENLFLSSSCSLLHVPYTLEGEDLPLEIREKLSFGIEKIEELKNFSHTLLPHLLDQTQEPSLAPFSQPQQNTSLRQDLTKSIQALGERAFQRGMPVEERLALQKASLKLPPLPTTTIGSFPQTAELRKLRQAFQKGILSQEAYEDHLREMIRQSIQKQEDIGLDVLVHGEFERNDMVEYFASFLSGFLTTKNGWVQSYGSRATKPPLIYGDITRLQPMTVSWITYAQSLTKKPVKAILTGPITIINWSFCREDISLREVAYQIALALREEINDLEKESLSIIQVDEAALREKLPLRKQDWKEYLDIAISAFRLATSGIKPQTQLHTHMCYSEFSDIADAIEAMDADVLTIEASRSDLDILEPLREYSHHRDIGPGVYDIHSPRIPSEEEIFSTIKKFLTLIPLHHLWINPDCGLKTRQEQEAYQSLANMVKAVKKIRSTLP